MHGHAEAAICKIMQQSNLTASKRFGCTKELITVLRWRKSRGWTHYAFCLSVHLPVRSYACTEHICFWTRITQFYWENVNICRGPSATTNVTSQGCDPVTSEGCQLCSLSSHTNRRAPRCHLSISGNLRLSGGHLIILSQWAEIKNVLLCPWFCHDLKPYRAGNNSPPHACEKRRWRTRYSTKVAGWKCLIDWPLCWQPALMENFVTEFFSLYFLWTEASCGRETTQITQKSQQVRHMVVKKHPVQ